LLRTVLPPRKLIEPKVEVVGHVGTGLAPRLVEARKGFLQVDVEEGGGGAWVEGDGGEVDGWVVLLGG
jgi:hypothetical protein